MADPGEGPAPPLFLAQNEARRAEKKFFLRQPPPPPSLSQGLDDRLLMLLGYPTRVPVRVPVNKLYVIPKRYHVIRSVIGVFRNAEDWIWWSRMSLFRNQGKFLLFESGIREIWVVEPGILGFGIRNTDKGVRNPTNDWNSKSKFHWRKFRNPESMAWKPESKTVLDFTWGEIPVMFLNSFIYTSS